MQPYQLASKETQEKSDRDMGLIKKGIGTLGKIATTAAGFGGLTLASKALPFLAEGLTAKNAIAGLTALSPKFGKFINESLKSGENFNDIQSFLKDKVMTAVESGPKSLFESLIGDIDLTSLGESIKKQLLSLIPIANQLEKKGKKEGDPEVNRLKDKIDKVLLKDPKLETMRQDASNQPELQPDQQQLQDMIMNQMGQEAQVNTGQQQPQGQMGQPVQMGQQQAQQPGQGQQALMAILQKIQAARGHGG